MEEEKKQKEDLLDMLRQQQPRSVQSTESKDRIYLNVPYNKKDVAKELGAWWDPKAKKWFAPKGINGKYFHNVNYDKLAKLFG